MNYDCNEFDHNLILILPVVFNNQFLYRIGFCSNKLLVYQQRVTPLYVQGHTTSVTRA